VVASVFLFVTAIGAIFAGEASQPDERLVSFDLRKLALREEGEVQQLFAARLGIESEA